MLTLTTCAAQILLGARSITNEQTRSITSV